MERVVVKTKPKDLEILKSIGGGNRSESARHKRLVLETRSRSPEMPMSQIAKAVGISRERVRQILKQQGLPTRALPTKALPQFCSDCGAPISKTNRSGLCAKCFKNYRFGQSRVTLVCEVCGSTFERTRTHYRMAMKRGYRHQFCSHVCQGRWLGRHYGRSKGGHP